MIVIVGEAVGVAEGERAEMMEVILSTRSEILEPTSCMSTLESPGETSPSSPVERAPGTGALGPGSPSESGASSPAWILEEPLAGAPCPEPPKAGSSPAGSPLVGDLGTGAARSTSW